MDTWGVLLFTSLLPGLISTGSPCAEFTGLLAASPCSSYFISCRHGIETRVNCSHGLIFNPERSQCDFKANIPSCKDQFSCASGDGYVGVGCSEVYWLCRNGIPSQQVCPNGLFFNDVNFSCDLKIGVPACGGVSRRISNSTALSSESSLTLPSVKSKSLNCHNFNNWKSALSLCNANFMECSKGVLTVGVCPSGSLFDSDRSSCVDVNQLDHCVGAIPEITTKSSLENECTNLEDGVYSTGCSRTFFTCTHKTQHVFECPNDLIYNEALELCDYHDSVQSCQGREADPIQKETMKNGSPKGKFRGSWKIDEIPANNKQREIDCSTLPDGFYSSGCTSEYVSCIGGEAQKYNCGNLVFNSVSGICDHPDRCVKTIANRHSTFTPGLHDLPNAIDCSKTINGIYSTGCVSSFTSCSEGIPSYGRCPEGLVYNQRAGFCDYVESCVVSANLKGRDTPGTLHSNPEADGIDCSIREDGFYSNRKCSPDFVACSNGQSQQRRCPDLLLFFDDFGYCDYPSVECDTIFESKSADHPLNQINQPEKNANQFKPLVANKSYECLTDGLFEIGCSSTYVSCSNGLSAHVTCPNNLVFNPSSKVCDYSCDIGLKNDVPVIDNTVNGINNPVFDSQKCDKDGPLPGQSCLPSFYVCFHGYRVLQNCPSSLVFSDHMQRCEYPDLCQTLKQTEIRSSSTPQINLNHEPSISHSSAIRTPIEYSSTIRPSSNQDFSKPVFSKPDFSKQDFSKQDFNKQDFNKQDFNKQDFNTQEANDFSCLHRIDGRYSIGGCYEIYALCASGRLSVQNCPNGLVFDALTASCEKQCMSGQQDAPHVVKAPQNSEQQNICLRGKRFALGQCKSAFLECTSGQQIFKECPSGTTFDIKYGLCIYDAPNCKAKDAAPVVPIYQQADFTEPQRPAICQVGVSYPRGDCENTYLRCVDGYNFEQLACVQNTRFDPISLECKDIFLISSCVHHEPTFEAAAESTPVFSDVMFLDQSHYGFHRHHAHHKHNSNSGEKWVRDGFQGNAHHRGRIISNPFYQGRKYAHGGHHHHHHHHHNHGHDHHRHRDVAYDHVRPHHRRHSVWLLDSFDGPKLRHTLISNPFYDRRHGKSRRVRVNDVFKRLRFPITDSIYTIFPPSHHRSNHHDHHHNHHRRHRKHKKNRKDRHFHGDMFEGSGYDGFERTADAYWKNSDVFNDVPEEDSRFKNDDSAVVEATEGVQQESSETMPYENEIFQDGIDIEDSREEPIRSWRRKRYTDVSPNSHSVLAVCQHGNANQAVAVGYCQQNFVFCTDELQQLVAACPVGESFDSVRNVCSDISECGTVPASVPQQSTPVVTEQQAPTPVSEQTEALPYAPQVVHTPVQPMEYQPLPAHIDQEFLPVYQQQYEFEALDGYNAVPLSQPQFVPTQAVAQPYVPEPISTPVHLAENQRHIQSDQAFHPVRQQQYEPEKSFVTEEIRTGYIGKGAAQPPSQLIVSSESTSTSQLTQHAVNVHPIPEQQHSQQNFQTESFQNSDVGTQSSALFAEAATLTKAVTGCAARPDGVFALGCSSTFVTCVGGISYVSSCPAGLVFDGAILACNYPEETFCDNGVSNSMPVDPTFFVQQTDLDPNIFITAQDAHSQQEQDVFDASANSLYETSVVNQEHIKQPFQFAVPEFETPHSSVGYGDIFEGLNFGHVTPEQMMNAYPDGQQFDLNTVGDDNLIHNKNIAIGNQDLRPMIQRFNATHVIVIDPAAPTNFVVPPSRLHNVQDPVFVLNDDHRIPDEFDSGPATHAYNDDYLYKKHSVPNHPNFQPKQNDRDFLVPIKNPIGEKHHSFTYPQDQKQQEAVHKEPTNTNLPSSSRISIPFLASLSEEPSNSSATSQIGASEPFLTCSARTDGGYFLNCDGGFIMCVSGQMHLVKCAGFTNFNETTQKCEHAVGGCTSVPGSATDPYAPTVFKKQFDDSMVKEGSDEKYHLHANPVSDLVSIIEHKPFSGKDSSLGFSHAQNTEPYSPPVVSLSEVFEADAADIESVVPMVEKFDHTKLEASSPDLPYHPSPTVLPYRPSITVLPYRPSVTGLPYRSSVSSNVTNNELAYTNIPEVISEDSSEKTNTYEEYSSSPQLAMDSIIVEDEKPSPEPISEVADQEGVIAKVSSYCSEQNVAVADICAPFFYVCSYGVVKKMLCSSGEVFNPASTSCDLISNIPECNVGYSHPLVIPSEEPLPVNRKDNKKEVGIPSKNSIYVSTEEPQTAKYTINAADVTKVPGVVKETTLAALRSESGMPCDSQETSVFPIAHCHITYAVCESTGFARAANCSPSYLFDHALFKCVPSQECGSSQIKEFLAALDNNSDSLSEVCEDAQSNEMRALGECRRSYAVCGTRPSVERCPKKTIFVQSKQKCIDRKDVAACQTHEKVSPKAATTTQTTILRSSNEHIDVVQFCVSKNDGYYRSPEKCTGVVQCFNGEMIEHSPCPSGLVFNNILKNCDYPVNIAECSEEMAHSNQEDSCVHGAHIADDNDCSIFYRCVWNRKIKMDCPANTAFNPNLAVCDYVDAVPQCSSRNIDILESEQKFKITDTTSH